MKKRLRYLNFKISIINVYLWRKLNFFGFDQKKDRFEMTTSYAQIPGKNRKWLYNLKKVVVVFN